MKHLSLAALAAGALLCVAPTVRAQVSPFGGTTGGSFSGGGGFPGGGGQNASNRNNNNTGNNNGATLDLPPDVERLVAVDAYNTIIIQNRDGSLKPRYETYKTLHIPARGIARIFGGDVITTEQLLGLDLIGQGGFANGGVGNGNFTGGVGGQNNFGSGFNNNPSNGTNTGIPGTSTFGGTGTFGGGNTFNNALSPDLGRR